MSKTNWGRVQASQKLYDDRRTYGTGAPASVQIAAGVLIKKTFENSPKALFQWTDAELYCLGKTIRKEWKRRQSPLTYKNGQRVLTAKDGRGDRFRYPGVTGEYLRFRDKD